MQSDTCDEASRRKSGLVRIRDVTLIEERISTWGPDQVSVRFQLSRVRLEGSWREVESGCAGKGNKSWRMKLNFDQQRWMGTEKQSTGTHDCDHLFSL